MSKTVPQELSIELDQYYTDPVYAQHFFDVVKQNVDINDCDILLEPSAGTGSFYNILDINKRIGLDLDPKASGVIKTNFFDWMPPIGKKIYTIGNPPFGKNANLAVKFFNESAKFSDVIAFVIPRTFRKASLINRLNKHFHLVYDETVPDNSFIFNGSPYNVWCCAQIWVRKSEKRDKVETLKLSELRKWFTITEPVDSDFAIQRVGGKAGIIRLEDRINFSKASHYFIKSHHPDVLKIFKLIDFNQVKFNTAGNPSISPSELANLWLEQASPYGIHL
jgi:hypothetical protein